MAAYAGIDTDQYPGDAVWPLLKASTPVTWSGCYLAPAPDHSDTGWMTKRAVIEAAGIATVPVFLGRQLTGAGAQPGMVNGPQGTADANTASALMHAFGKPSGSYCFMDRETPSTGPAETAYVKAWAEAMESSSFGWGVGLYVSHLTAAYWRSVLPNARLWVYRLIQGHSVESLADLPGPSPDGAALWQFAQDQQLEVGGHRMLIDFNLSTTADPSAP